MRELEALRPIDERMTKLLVDNHRRFRSFLEKRVGDAATAEDLLQQSLKKALENPARSEEELSVVAWFYQILRNALTDHYRAHASEIQKNDKFLQLLEQEDRTQVHSPDELQAEVCACMTSLLPALHEGYSELIQRIDLNGESIPAVAADLGVTENNLNVRLHRARKALKTSLDLTCGTCTEHGCLSCTCGE